MFHIPAIRASVSYSVLALALVCALPGCQTLESLDRQTDRVLDDINDPSPPSSTPPLKTPAWTPGDAPRDRPAQGREKATVECWDSFPTAKKGMHARYEIAYASDHQWHHVVGQVNASRGDVYQA